MVLETCVKHVQYIVQGATKQLRKTILFFLYKNKRYSFVQIDRVHRYNTIQIR